MPHPAYISDTELAKIPIQDNGEGLVSLWETVPNLAVDFSEYIMQQEESIREQMLLARVSVAERLATAASLLPPGCRILLRSGYRPISLQKAIYEEMEGKIRTEFPDWTDEQVIEELDGRVAPLWTVPPHTTGAAVDIALGDANGVWDMGCAVGEFNEKAACICESLTPEEREKREILINAMTAAGFVNYPPEWWHWSYGDRYWAAELGREYAIYGSV